MCLFSDSLERPVFPRRYTKTATHAHTALVVPLWTKAEFFLDRQQAETNRFVTTTGSSVVQPIISVFQGSMQRVGGQPKAEKKL